MTASPSIQKNRRVDQWISITRDRRVCVYSGKVDLGQGISAALRAIVADELDVDPARIFLQPRSTDLAPDEGYTVGSNSIEHSGQALRSAAATLRAEVFERAAVKLGVDPSTLVVRDGLIRSTESKLETSLWDVAGDRGCHIEIDEKAPRKPAQDLRYVGRCRPPEDIREIVTGRFRYLHDLRWDGMLYARVVRPPNYHAELDHIPADAGALLERRGLSIVVRGSFVAVAGESEIDVVRGTERLRRSIVWSAEKDLSSEDVFSQLERNDRVRLPVVAGIPRSEPVPEFRCREAGSGPRIRARYDKAYLAHGSLAPSVAAALKQESKLTVWTHSQGIYPLRDCLSDALAIDPGIVRVVHVNGSGCYGHNGADDAALDAALVAMAVPGRPVLLKWSRQDEHAWEPYGPAMSMFLEAVLDEGGKVVAWSHETCSDGHIMRPFPGPDNDGAARLLATRYLPGRRPPEPARPVMSHHAGIHRNLEPIYAFPRTRLVKTLVADLPLRTSSLRSLGAAGNVFAIESFMDELAAASSSDPMAFRRRHLDDPRALEVLESLEERFAGSRRDLPAGVGAGIAFARYKNEKTYCAVGVELEVTDRAEVRLRHAAIVADAGQIVDRHGLVAQLEGGFLQAASWALYEAVTWNGAGVTSTDWETCPVLRFDNVCSIETHVIDRPDEPSLGAGEVSCGPGVAAIANAVADASGLRVRRLPMTPDAIRAAALDA